MASPESGHGGCCARDELVLASIVEVYSSLVGMDSRNGLDGIVAAAHRQARPPGAVRKQRRKDRRDVADLRRDYDRR